MRTHSDTRWWSKWDILQQALYYFAVCQHLLEIFDDHQDFQDLRLELAAVVDASVHFVSATYYLEGDTPLIFTCYERLCSVASAVAVEHYPNTTAFAREIAGGNAVTYNQLMTQAKACIQPGLNFYQQKSVVLCKFNITQWLPPWRNSETFHFWIMTTSLPTWPESSLTTADGVVMEDEEEKLAWWAANIVRLPHWASCYLFN